MSSSKLSKHAPFITVLVAAVVLGVTGRLMLDDFTDPTEVQTEAATVAPPARPVAPSVARLLDSPTPPVIQSVQTPSDPSSGPVEAAVADRRRVVTPPAQAASGRRRVVRPVEPRTRLLTGAVIWVPKLTDYRVNLFLNTDPRMPWDNMAFRQEVQVDESRNAFPIHIWRHRHGQWVRIKSLWMEVPKGDIRATMNTPTPIQASEFTYGDLLLVEYRAGLLVEANEANPLYLDAPYLSVISHNSNDPFTLGFTRFPQQVVTY